MTLMRCDVCCYWIHNSIGGPRPIVLKRNFVDCVIVVYNDVRRRLATVTIDICYPDTVLPIHIAWHVETTAKSTTKYGRR